jgi:vacuolar-type H+-ATPase subunit F/Vma7
MTTGAIVFVGAAADARGFRLAGVAAVSPTRAAIDGAVSRWLAPDAKRPALVIVSAEAMAEARDRLAALEADADGPVVVVLPDEGGRRLRQSP